MAAKMKAASASANLAHPLVVEAAAVLRARGQTVGFAESCTGGLLSALFAGLPGASRVFRGSIVAYDNQVKEELLDVPMPTLQALGAVSTAVARHMAVGARQALRTTWAVSITGIAGPDGGTPTKPVGTVCFAVVGPGVDRTIQRHIAGSTRRQVQARAARFALRLLLFYLHGDAKRS